MQLQRHLEEFEAAGVAVFAISYDPPEAVASFAREHGITYSLLSDEGSEVIRRFGILNTLVRPDEPVYGIPFPGSYLVDEDGVVTEKVFHRVYRVRDGAESVLHSGFGAPLDEAGHPAAEAASPGVGVRVRAVLGADELVFQRRAYVYVRMTLDEGLHVYGKPVPEGYFPTEVEVSGPEGLAVEEPRYPPTHPMRLEALGETFEVFEGEVEIAVPVVAGMTEEGTAALEVRVQYQACDDRQCFLPQRHVLRLEVPVRGLNRPPRRD